MKCANCQEDAVYIYKLTSEKSIAYCKQDLPKFLDERRKAGLLETTNGYKELLVEGQKTLAVVIAEPVAVEESPFVEEQELVDEETTSVKKAAKKKAE